MPLECLRSGWNLYLNERFRVGRKTSRTAKLSRTPTPAVEMTIVAAKDSSHVRPFWLRPSYRPSSQAFGPQGPLSPRRLFDDIVYEQNDHRAVKRIHAFEDKHTTINMT